MAEIVDFNKAVRRSLGLREVLVPVPPMLEAALAIDRYVGPDQPFTTCALYWDPERDMCVCNTGLFEIEANTEAWVSFTEHPYAISFINGPGSEDPIWLVLDAESRVLYAATECHARRYLRFRCPAQMPEGLDSPEGLNALFVDNWRITREDTEAGTAACTTMNEWLNANLLPI